MVYMYCFHIDVRVLERGTVGTQIRVMVYIGCTILFINV